MQPFRASQSFFSRFSQIGSHLFCGINSFLFQSIIATAQAMLLLCCFCCFGTHRAHNKQNKRRQTVKWVGGCQNASKAFRPVRK